MSKAKIAESTPRDGLQKADLQSESETLANFPQEKYAIIKESGSTIKGMGFEFVFLQQFVSKRSGLFLCHLLTFRSPLSPLEAQQHFSSRTP